ncbi:MAG: lipocalin family protein [Bacteroidota bacterium]
MKKNTVFNLILILAAVFTFSSCSSDDDGGVTQESTSLFGTWELDFMVINGETILDIPCEDQVRYSFTSNFTYTQTNFTGEDLDNCEVASTVNGEWENIENDELILSPIGANQPENLDIEFTQNAQRFRVFYSNGDEEVFEKVN